jgi:hypothetical protein
VVPGDRFLSPAREPEVFDPLGCVFHNDRKSPCERSTRPTAYRPPAPDGRKLATRRVL